jgi:hypothetical protein
MGTWKNVAEIQIDQIIPVVHLAAALHQADHLLVVRQAVDHLLVDHHHDQVLLILLVAQHVLIQLDLHHDHRDQIQIAAAKIYQHAVVHLLDQVRQVEIAKGAMQMIRAVFARRLWIAINQDCVREFLNQIFLKMLQVKNSKKQLARNY